MPVKENPTKEVKCKCGKTTTVNIKAARAYCEITRFVCDCGQVFHITDYINGCITYWTPSKEVADAHLKQIKEDKQKENSSITITPNQKECFNHCPNCDAGKNDIDWGDKDWSDESAYYPEMWQNATCTKCGCDFSEVYLYSFTELENRNVYRAS
jgi:hypothetical protein